MNRRFGPSVRGIALIHLLLTAGCQLALDADLVGKGDQGGMDGGMEAPACPPGFVCTPEQIDAGGQPDSGGDGPDAGGQPDAGDEADASPPGCGTDQDCGTEEFCSVTGECQPLCDGLRGCVMLSTGRVEALSMLRGDGRIYWSSAARFDALGNSLDDGAIWELLPSGASRKVLDGLAHPILKLCVDEQLYFAPGDGVPVHRVSVSGGVAEPVVMPGDKAVTSVAASDSYLWFVSKSVPSEATGGLWRAPRETGTNYEFVKDLEQADGLLAARDSLVAVDTGDMFFRLALHPTTAAAPELVNLSASQGFFHGDLFVGCGFARATTLNLTTGQTRTVAKSGPDPESFGVPCDVHGDWLVWTSWRTGGMYYVPNGIALGRSHLDLAVDVEEIAVFPVPEQRSWIPGPPMVMSPWSDEIYYYSPVEKRFFRRALPPFPCPEGVACPEGYECQPNHTCQREN